jgi:hypothetical protein
LRAGYTSVLTDAIATHWRSGEPNVGYVKLFLTLRSAKQGAKALRDCWELRLSRSEVQEA